MTVEEFIKKLNEQPKNADVVYYPVGCYCDPSNIDVFIIYDERLNIIKISEIIKK